MKQPHTGKRKEQVDQRKQQRQVSVGVISVVFQVPQWSSGRRMLSDKAEVWDEITVMDQGQVTLSFVIQTKPSGVWLSVVENISWAFSREQPTLTGALRDPCGCHVHGKQGDV